ncbi:MAG: hypothetical protein ACJKSS_00415 [Patescibacteria group bacterium UBA2103]
MKYVVIIALLSLPLMLLAAPRIPHQVYGSVSGFSSGTVSALVDGDTIASTSIEEDGSFGQNTFFFIEDVDGDLAGETVSFLIDGSQTNETLVYQNGSLSEINLTLYAPSGGGVSVSSGSSSSVPSSPSFDFTGDGVVDIKDFNFLMSNWGTPAADLNGDGTTDILDFNLLMAHWS